MLRVLANIVRSAEIREWIYYAIEVSAEDVVGDVVLARAQAVIVKQICVNEVFVRTAAMVVIYVLARSVQNAKPKP